MLCAGWIAPVRGARVNTLVNHLREEEAALDSVLAALASPHRRRVVELLALQPATVRQAAAHTGLSLAAIDRHLKVLHDAGLVQRRKQGRVNFLALRRPALQLLHQWSTGFDPYWGTDGDSLDNYLAALERRPRLVHTKETR